MACGSSATSSRARPSASARHTSPSAVVHYTIDRKQPTAASPAYSAPRSVKPLQSLEEVDPELLKTYKPQKVVLYGTSAGAILTSEVAVRLKQLGLPLPAALGVFSGLGDFSVHGDSEAIFGLWGLSGVLTIPVGQHDDAYVGKTDPRDPVLSPVYADLKGMPPTLFLTSDRDLLLSGTANLHRAFVKAGVDAQLIVFDGLHHAFWNEFKLPESVEAHHMMAAFFEKQLGK